MRTSSSQEEGCERRWSVLTKELRGDDGQVRELFGIEVNWLPGPKDVGNEGDPGTEFILPADLVLIAMGFLHVVRNGLLEELGVKLDPRGNVVVDNWMSTRAGRFRRRRHRSRRLAGGPRHQPRTDHGRRRRQVAAEVVPAMHEVLNGILLESGIGLSPGSFSRTWGFLVPSFARAASSSRRIVGGRPSRHAADRRTGAVPRGGTEYL